MIKKLLSIALVSTSVLANAQSFTATYDFAAVPTQSLSTGATDPTAPPVVTGITFGSFSAVGTSTSSASAGRFSFNNFDLAALSGSTSATTYSAMGGTINLNKYYDVTITPSSSNNVTIDSIKFISRRTGTGPRSFAIRSSVDGYANNLNAMIVPTSTLLSIAGTNEFFYSVDAGTSTPYNTGPVALPALTFNNAVSFRIYAWNAESLTGNLGVDDVTFKGSTSITTGLGTITADLNSNFNMYPVPNNDGVVYINNKNNVEISNIEVIDMLGNIVSTTTDNKTALNLAHVSNGTYFVRIYANNSVTTQKIVINK